MVTLELYVATILSLESSNCLTIIGKRMWLGLERLGNREAKLYLPLGFFIPS